MYLIKRYRPGNPKSPWALYDTLTLSPSPDELVALFTYRKGARKVLELLMELHRLNRVFANLHLISDLIETDKVADRRR